MSQKKHVVDNILLSGFLREHEGSLDIQIPKLVAHILRLYSKAYDMKQIGLSHEYSSETLGSFKHRCIEINISQATKPMKHKKMIDDVMNTTFNNNDIDDDIIDIQCGCHHTLFLTSSGNVYSFGSNQSGQCALGSNIHSVEIPTLIPFESKIKSIACGELHSLFIDENGKLLCCGYNYCGQLGIDSESYPNSSCTQIIATETVSIESRFLWEQETEDYNTYNTDNFECCFIDISDNESEEETDDDFDDTKNCSVYEPIFNPYFKDLNVRFINIECGAYHSLAITTNGECYTFGHNGFGSLGNGACTDDGDGVNIPYKLNINKKFVRGSCGDNHNILITEENEIVVFGDNTNKQCSVMDTDKIKDPLILSKQKEFGIAENCYIEKIICSENKSLFIFDIYKRNLL